MNPFSDAPDLLWIALEVTREYEGTVQRFGYESWDEAYLVARCWQLFHGYVSLLTQ